MHIKYGGSLFLNFLYSVYNEKRFENHNKNNQKFVCSENSLFNIVEINDL